MALEVIATAIREGKQRKRNPNLKRSKINDMILYTENPEDGTRKLLELINESVQVVGYKINRQESVAFLYTNNRNRN